MSDPGTIHIVGATDPGRRRERNEDHLAVDEALGIAVVADGMGGLSDGHVASREAVAGAMSLLQGAGRPFSTATLEAALTAAHERVRARARVSGTVMGTTAVLVSLDRGRCGIAHVGDSRAYRFRGGELSQLTRDHSMVQEMVDRGVLTREAARVSPDRSVVTRAIGLEQAFEVDSTEFDLKAGELLLLCSDGLSDMLEDERLAALLSRCGAGRGGLERCALALVDAANEAGGWDNVTVVLARCL